MANQFSRLHRECLSEVPDSAGRGRRDPGLSWRAVFSAVQTGPASAGTLTSARTSRACYGTYPPLACRDLRNRAPDPGPGLVRTTARRAPVSTFRFRAPPRSRRGPGHARWFYAARRRHRGTEHLGFDGEVSTTITPLRRPRSSSRLPCQPRPHAPSRLATGAVPAQQGGLQKRT